MTDRGILIAWIGIFATVTSIAWAAAFASVYGAPSRKHSVKEICAMYPEARVSAFCMEIVRNEPRS